MEQELKERISEFNRIHENVTDAHT